MEGASGSLAEHAEMVLQFKPVKNVYMLFLVSFISDFIFIREQS